MEYQTLIVEEVGGVAVLKLNRPKALNALNSDLLGELNLFIDDCEKSETLRCLIITGNSEKSFVAGADITEFSGMKPEDAMRFAEYGQNTFSRLEDLKVPVIAAVNGFALGGGLELALACDFIISSEKGRFGLPEVSLGIMPGYGGTQRLKAAVGLRLAREMTYTGNHYRANEALSMGLVNRVVAPEQLLDTAKEVAAAILQRAPLAVSHCKRVILQSESRSRDEGMKLEAEAFSQLFATEDAKEGAKAFVEKRTPEFQGR